MEQKRLVRSERSKIVAGVCGGIAEYLALDPNIVRAVCLALIVLQPAFALLYLLLVFLLPHEGAEGATVEERLESGVQELGRTVERVAGGAKPAKGRLYVGLALVVIGLVLLLENLGIWWVDGSLIGALLLIGAGLFFLLGRDRQP